jgi:hypothetical protein
VSFGFACTSSSSSSSSSSNTNRMLVAAQIAVEVHAVVEEDDIPGFN